MLWRLLPVSESPGSELVRRYDQAEPVGAAAKAGVEGHDPAAEQSGKGHVSAS